MYDVSDDTQFRTWTNPGVSLTGESVIEFLHNLAGPAHIHLYGQDRQRSRVVVTLLHGNEPSGVNAIWQVLKHGLVPAVDIHFFIPNVAAAIEPPGFSYRMLPGRRDLNRCFSPPFADAQGLIAEGLLDAIAELTPEAVIDIHNTSGEGPSFAVTTHMDDRHDALVSLFSHRVVVTDLRLGALMELSERLCPTVTIECGGAHSEAARHTAVTGLQKFMTMTGIFGAGQLNVPLDFYHNPIRLELRDKVAGHLSYGVAAASEGLTLLPDIEKYNFKVVTTEDCLGFISAEGVHELVARNARGEDKVRQYFCSREGRLYATTDLKLFMITGNREIARKDCLFYFVDVSKQHSV